MVEDFNEAMTAGNIRCTESLAYDNRQKNKCALAKLLKCSESARLQYNIFCCINGPTRSQVKKLSEKRPIIKLDW